MDVIVFRYPRDTTKSYIKRVVALPGDTFADRPRPPDRERQNLCPNLMCLCALPTTAHSRETRLPPDDYFVYGRPPVDFEATAVSSGRSIAISSTVKAAFVYWPMEQAGRRSLTPDNITLRPCISRNRTGRSAAFPWRTYDTDEELANRRLCLLDAGKRGACSPCSGDRYQPPITVTTTHHHHYYRARTPLLPVAVEKSL